MAITDKGDNTGNVFIDALAAYSFLDIGGDRNITYSFATGGNVSAHVWSLYRQAVVAVRAAAMGQCGEHHGAGGFHDGRGPAGGVGRFRCQ